MRCRVAGSVRSAARASPASSSRSYRSWVEAIAPAAYTSHAEGPRAGAAGSFGSGGSGGYPGTAAGGGAEYLAAVPGRAQLGQDEPVKAVPAGVAPGQDEQARDQDHGRVDPGAAGEHEREVQDRAQEGHDAGEQPQDQRDADHDLADGHQRAEKGVAGVAQPLQPVDIPGVGDVGVLALGAALQGPAGEPGHGVADLQRLLLAALTDHGARADPADVAVAGQAVGVLAPVPDLPGDGAAEQLVPAGVEPLPAQPQPDDQPDPGGLARSEQPLRECRLLDVHRCTRRTPIGGACHGATRLLSFLGRHRAARWEQVPAAVTPGHGANGGGPAGPPR